MKKALFGALLLFGAVCCVAQGFRNPVLSGFHADPSVCRVGNSYYLVNSTFQFYPGVPVFKSADLIHWQQVGACLTRKSQFDLAGLDHNNGIYAPTIRYHKGTYYMVTTIFPSRRHFYVTTQNPEGEWSDPIVIDFAIGSCDPTLFFDDDDKCYFLWKDGEIKICEIDPKTGRQLSEIQRLWSGLGGRYPEGPHIYKKDGFYYLMLAEGGTEHGHHVTIARSRYLYGPYESNPANPILSHFSCAMQNSPIQGLGHADLVQAADSSWWMICLGYRTSGYLQHVMGRETMLAPVVWDKNAWPVVNGNGTISIDMDCKTLPQVETIQAPEKEGFSNTKLSPEWMYLRFPVAENYSLSARKGFLRIFADTATVSGLGTPSFVGRRQTELNFRATTKIDLSGLKDNSLAGLTAFAAHTNHYDVRARKQADGYFVESVLKLGDISHASKAEKLKSATVYLRIESNRDSYILSYSEDGESFKILEKQTYRFLSTETIGGFTGVMIGLFAESEQPNRPFADFDWFEYTIK